MKRIRDECEKLNIKFKEKIVDGKNSDQIIEEAKGYDLLIMGAQGLGKVNLPYRLGSNSRRTLRHTNIDLLFAKRDVLPKKNICRYRWKQTKPEDIRKSDRNSSFF